MIVDEVDAKCNLVDTAADVKFRNVWILCIMDRNVWILCIMDRNV